MIDVLCRNPYSYRNKNVFSVCYSVRYSIGYCVLYLVCFPGFYSFRYSVYYSAWCYGTNISSENESVYGPRPAYRSSNVLSSSHSHFSERLQKKPDPFQEYAMIPLALSTKCQLGDRITYSLLQRISLHILFRSIPIIHILPLKCREHYSFSSTYIFSRYT